MATQSPPFRAEVVGSLLRPEKLKAARERFLGAQTHDSNLGTHDNAELRAVEDDCIREAVALQERAGLQVVTDGEYRRRSWWTELILNWQGFAADRTGTTRIMWRNAAGPTQGSSSLYVTGPIRWRPSPLVRAFEFLKAQTRATPKVTLPAPSVLHYMMCGTGNLPRAIYADADAFWHDLVAAYRQELAALAAAGATYIQLDETAIPCLCDPAHRDFVRSWGEDPDALVRLYAAKINACLEGLPAQVTVALHQCRGNREGNWVAEGGYDPVADVLFNTIGVTAYFLEYDTPRAGGFAPLRLLPKGKTAVLGLVSSKNPALESADMLMRRIEEAAKYAPLEQLALSPQCGFASSIRGNPLGERDQQAKLERIVEVARRVWG
jgi:5-methyltetrahydropteroyltriglutamate--homocysteine methyltransferase